MMNRDRNELLTLLVETLELPRSAYEKAVERYRDLGGWMEREGSACQVYAPAISSQGSFRLGTANRPIDDKEDYDLDLTCNLRQGVTPATHTQSELKELVGGELANYREARGIKEPLERKHRCWRLVYADQLSFHMDIVPSIPEADVHRVARTRAMTRFGLEQELAEALSEHGVLITDDRHPGYTVLTPEWPPSNPEGYARWFESRMRLARSYLASRAAALARAEIAEVPVYRWKTPLQRVIQLLKRHRDLMYRNNPEAKPISIIITTLAAQAYQGEGDLAAALDTILRTMGDYVQATSPRVPNPVRPEEDFADRWATPEGRRLRLEEQFWAWLRQAQRDFERLIDESDAEVLNALIEGRFAVRLSSSRIAGLIGVSVPPAAAPQVLTETARPWARHR